MVHVAATMEFDETRGYIERREGDRHISVFRVGRMVCERGDQLCVVRNLSSGGAMIEVSRPPAVGIRIGIDLRSDRSFMATVRWTREREAGIQFDHPVDVESVIREERQSILRLQPRAPRFQRVGKARILASNDTCEGSISNISINGIAILTPKVFARDEPVIVSIEGLGATHAFVRWSARGETGLKLNSPLSYRALAEWLETHPAPVVEG